MQGRPSEWEAHGVEMGLTYFKRLRMEYDLTARVPELRAIPEGYQLVAYADDLVREHATAKYKSFRQELDANVFPCLGRRDGCLRLMREIVSRASFVRQATWLLRYWDAQIGRSPPLGTIHGLQVEGGGAIHNERVEPAHRGRGLGSLLLSHAASGFREVGLTQMHLEVTIDNVAAIRLYERLGFRRTRVVYKAAEVAGA